MKNKEKLYEMRNINFKMYVKMYIMKIDKSNK